MDEAKKYFLFRGLHQNDFQDKSDLFEVTIIRLSTKNELDSAEKELIAKYDAMRNGYNGTPGNS